MFGFVCGQTCSCEKRNTMYCQPGMGKCVCKSGWHGKYRVKVRIMVCNTAFNNISVISWW